MKINRRNLLPAQVCAPGHVRNISCLCVTPEGYTMATDGHRAIIVSPDQSTEPVEAPEERLLVSAATARAMESDLAAKRLRDQPHHQGATYYHPDRERGRDQGEFVTCQKGATRCYQTCDPPQPNGGYPPLELSVPKIDGEKIHAIQIDASVLAGVLQAFTKFRRGERSKAMWLYVNTADPLETMVLASKSDKTGQIMTALVMPMRPGQPPVKPDLPESR